MSWVWICFLWVALSSRSASWLLRLAVLSLDVVMIHWHRLVSWSLSFFQPSSWHPASSSTRPVLSLLVIVFLGQLLHFSKQFSWYFCFNPNLELTWATLFSSVNPPKAHNYFWLYSYSWVSYFFFLWPCHSLPSWCVSTHPMDVKT